MKKDYVKSRCHLDGLTPEQLIEKCYKLVLGYSYKKEATELKDGATALFELKKYVELYKFLEKYCIIYGKLKITDNGRNYTIDGNGITET